MWEGLVFEGMVEDVGLVVLRGWLGDLWEGYVAVLREWLRMCGRG